MSSNTGGKSAAPRKRGNQTMMAGILVGMIIGVGVAAGMAWYLMKSPTPFLQKEPVAGKLTSDSASQNSPAGTSNTGISDGKPRFEFYKVLTDKQDKTVSEPNKTADKAKAADRKPVLGYEPHLLQAGSFQKVEEAEKRKGELAFLGLEASIQSATIPDKGIWYRVRLGPYLTAEELDRVRGLLLSNGMASTPVRVQ